MRVPVFLAMLLMLAANVWSAESDPTVSEVYREAHAGHLERAQQMMQQVLRDHPDSAKAHYVMAELYAASGERTSAAEELQRARQLSPGLSFARPESVRKLERELLQPDGGQMRASGARRDPIVWGFVALAVGLAFIAFLMRRRPPPPSNPVAQASPLAMPPTGTPSMQPEAQASAFATPTARSGIGSAVAGGLAAGAGIVAGEALASRLFGTSNEHPVEAPTTAPPQNDGPVPDDDLGGNDFGLRDPDSWDDDSNDDDDDLNNDDGWQ